jgi:multidrug efflux pump subunit AcrB
MARVAPGEHARSWLESATPGAKKAAPRRCSTAPLQQGTESNVADVQEETEMFYRGKQLSEVRDGEQRLAVAIRLPDRLRNDPQSLAALQIKTPTGALVRLDQFALFAPFGAQSIVPRARGFSPTTGTSL